MNGMIFAAGLGSRLAPLTDSRPKALVEVGGQTLLDGAIDYLIEAGVDNIVVNVHHFASQIADFISSNRDNWDATIAISDESDLLLETGGGLVKALPLFPDDGFIVACNVDVVCTADLSQLIEAHKQSHADATLMTSERSSSRHLLFGADGNLCGWENVEKGETRMARNVEPAFREAFNGIHVIEQDLVRSFLPSGEQPRPLPIVDAYLNAASFRRISRWLLPANEQWFDVGTPEKLQQAENFFSNL